MLRNLFSRRPPASEASKVVVVSGLPRSGTSMMMKMLAEGGLPILMDSIREADEDNPNGYFEIELSKKLKDGEVKWIYGARGRAVKVISYLLEHLPGDLTYDVLFMERDLKEILASQHKMLERRGEISRISDEEMTGQYQEHLKSVKYWLPRQPNMRVLYVNYRALLAGTEGIFESIREFLDLPLDVQAMSAVPNQALYRNRA